MTSGVVSPSELPDSPTQTVPPSPRHHKHPASEFGRKAQVEARHSFQNQCKLYFFSVEIIFEMIDCTHALKKRRRRRIFLHTPIILNRLWWVVVVNINGGFRPGCK